MEERDLYFVDRALMDFAAAGEEGWEGREGDVRVKALWVHPIKVSERCIGCCGGEQMAMLRLVS
jgi:hypothetical protein